MRLLRHPVSVFGLSLLLLVVLTSLAAGRAAASFPATAPLPAPPLTEAQLAALHLVPAWDITYTYNYKSETIGTATTGLMSGTIPAHLVGVLGPLTGISFNRIEKQGYTMRLTVAGANSQSDCGTSSPCVPKLTEYPASFTLLEDSRILNEAIQFEYGCPEGQVSDNPYAIPGTTLTGAQLHNPPYAKYNGFLIYYSTNPPTADWSVYTAGLSGQFSSTSAGCLSGTTTQTGPFPREYYNSYTPFSGDENAGDTQVRFENGRFVIRGSSDFAAVGTGCDGILFSCFQQYNRDNLKYPSSTIIHAEWVVTAHDPTIPKIHSVEFTQAIQEWQPLAALKADIFFDGTPPVPIVAKKPTTMRVFVDQVPAVTSAIVEVSGLVSGEFSMALQPHCTPEMRRRLQQGCYGFDFDFVPPVGDWTVTVKLKDEDGNEFESHTLNLTSKESDALVLQAVSVCDSVDASGVWQCASASDLGPLVNLLRHIAPTDDLRVEVTNHQVKFRAVGDLNGDTDLNDCYDSVAPFDGTADTCEYNRWWSVIASKLNSLFQDFDLYLGGVFGEQRYYYGMVRPAVGGYLGIANAIDSRGAASVTSYVLGGIEGNQWVVAHETGHMLGLRHTNTDVPVIGAAPPGCWLGKDKKTDWPYPDNRIQQVGINTYTGALMLPETNFDVIGYCLPIWISSHSTKNFLKKLDPPPPDPVGEPGSYWHIAGTIEGGAAVLDPLIKLTTLGPVGAGSGTHRIEVQDGSGAVLLTRFFTPLVDDPSPGPGMPDVEGIPHFSELVPVQAAGATILVKDAANFQIGQVTLDGTAPAVTITSPLGGTMNGVQTVSWSVSDPDSASHTFQVHYSADGGATWKSQASSLGEHELKVDFNTLPGSAGTSRIRVIASDGVNSSEAVSPPFTVGPKLPQAEILFPENGALFAQQEMVVLQGQGFDVDDGFLKGASLQWSSRKDGALGTGAELPVTTLSTGVHVISLKATDSQGNQTQDTVTIYVGTQAPADLPEGSPTANPGGPYTGQALAPIIFDGTGSSDPEGQPLTYSWDFGDGQTGTGASPSHAYAVAGTYLVSLTVTDPIALSHAQATLAMVQEAEPSPTPIANAGPDQTVDEGSTVTLPPATFVDPDVGETHTATITWGDGASSVGTVSESPQTVSGAHTYPDNGVFTVTVKVVDSGGLSGTDSFIATVKNVAPTVNAGPNAAINEGGTFNSSGSFTDPGADTWTATVNYGDGSGIDALRLNTDGTFNLSHQYKESGVFAVIVVVNDKDGGAGADMALVIVKNLPPIVDAGPDVDEVEGGPVYLKASFTDPGVLDTHTATISWGDGTVTSGTVNEGAHTVSASHVYADNGVYAVTVTVTDNSGASSADSLIVKMANAAPVVSAVPYATTIANVSLTRFLATISDPGAGDTHKASIDWGDGSVTPGQVSSGVVYGTHKYTNLGLYTVTITVKDDDGGVGMDTLKVLVEDPRRIPGR